VSGVGVYRYEVCKLKAEVPRQEVVRRGVLEKVQWRPSCPSMMLAQVHRSRCL